MTATIEYIVSKSGDSVLERYVFQNHVLEIALEMDELDSRVVLEIPTEAVWVSSWFGNDEISKLCHMGFVSLEGVLDSENGIYVPPKSFPELMKQCRSKANLAYGKRVSEVEMLFQLKSSNVLLACTVGKASDIRIKSMD